MLGRGTSGEKGIVAKREYKYNSRARRCILFTSFSRWHYTPTLPFSTILAHHPFQYRTFLLFFSRLSIFHQAIRATEWTRIERRPIHGNRDDSRNARSVPAQEKRDTHIHTHTPVNDPCWAVLRVHRLSRHSQFSVPSMKGRYRSSRDDRNFFDSILTSITLVLCELGQRKNGEVGWSKLR